MRIALASDHAGRNLKSIVQQHLEQAGHHVNNMGTDSEDSVDYPDFATKVALAIQQGEADLGILVCGTGIGISMAANRHKGVRAAVCHNEFTARATRAHNNANVLCMGERVLGTGVALSVVDAFIATEFEGGRHIRRVEKIDA